MVLTFDLTLSTPVCSPCSISANTRLTNCAVPPFSSLSQEQWGGSWRQSLAVEMGDGVVGGGGPSLTPPPVALSTVGKILGGILGASYASI